MEKQSSSIKYLSRPEITFWLNIVISAVMVAATLFQVKTELALLTQEVRYNNQILLQHITENKDLSKDYYDFKSETSKRLTILESR